ncbi:hypothetical protein [Devosia rhizoryzae]|uniref:Uncharacterized protein n=1 Tax=Devosia rhizoryzae TaxID=2774137 RepID=A0ABX7C2R6_9HYPH|nr:hypothetical protein [Devosia rhizoryzae]QQR38068.1 hypothetical protein JI748_09685 [Devosia rhizoryzae]
MSKRDALRGYLLHVAANAEGPLTLSSEQIWVVFASTFDDFTDFDKAFTEALVWMSAEGLVRYHSLSEGTNGEGMVVGLVTTQKGQEVHQDASVQRSAFAETNALHPDEAVMLGRFLEDWLSKTRL